MFRRRKHRKTTARSDVADSIARFLSLMGSGSITLEVSKKPTARIEINSGNKKTINVVPRFFRIPDDEIGFFDKLSTTKNFAQKLAYNMVTLSIFRKDKEAITLGEGANPSFSRMLTRSGDIQVNSLKELSQLKRDLEEKD
jgi:hypothetical protein